MSTLFVLSKVQQFDTIHTAHRTEAQIRGVVYKNITKQSSETITDKMRYYNTITINYLLMTKNRILFQIIQYTQIMQFKNLHFLASDSIA